MGNVQTFLRQKANPYHNSRGKFAHTADTANHHHISSWGRKPEDSSEHDDYMNRITAKEIQVTNGKLGFLFISEG